ncbi:hypothetical protein IEQ34_016829 [Dendrobium chrysotoxum]|uniref:Uncharacterized protein n=1 Tax=Dendrobium chrysotoxum TaxID=161865 RepID=A0AAV7FYR5_DENCH|nr:hypothetical protein IEQ34_016829 [Dendrobium chrysotoxum]
MKVDDFFEIGVGFVAFRGVGEGSDGGAAEPGDGGDEDDTVDYAALDISDEAIGDDEEAGGGEPECGALHTAVEAEEIVGDGGAGDEGKGAVWKGLDRG